MNVYYEKIFSSPFRIIGAIEAESYTLKPIFFTNSPVNPDDIKDKRFYRSYMALCMTINKNPDIPDSTTSIPKNNIRFHKNPISLSYNVDTLDVFRNLICLVFGKVLFDHGIIRSNAQIHIPSIDVYSPIKHIDDYCCNDFIRGNFAHGNNFGKCKPVLDEIIKLLSKDKTKISDMEESKLNSFLKSADLYYKALSYYNINETISFIMFVNCIEALTDDFISDEITDNIFYCDAETEKILNIIASDIENQSNKQHVEDFIYERMKATKKFINVILNFLDDDFYDHAESDNSVRSDISKEEIKKVLSELYGLRSKYLHNGDDIVDSIEYFHYKKRLRVPLYRLMERIARYILMNILNQLIIEYK